MGPQRLEGDGGQLELSCSPHRLLPLSDARHCCRWASGNAQTLTHVPNRKSNSNKTQIQLQVKCPIPAYFLAKVQNNPCLKCAYLTYLHKAQIKWRWTVVDQTISVPVPGPNTVPFVRPDILSAVTKKHRLLGGGIWLCLALVELDTQSSIYYNPMHTIQLQTACSLDNDHQLCMCEQYGHSQEVPITLSFSCTDCW